VCSQFFLIFELSGSGTTALFGKASKFLNRQAAVLVNDAALPFNGTCQVDPFRLVQELPARCWVKGLFGDWIIAPFRQRR
jgi:hypothetical protein